MLRLRSAKLMKLCTAGALALTLLAAPHVRGEDIITNELRVEIVSLRTDKGLVGCLLFTGEEGFPNAIDKALAHVKTIVEHGRATCVFDDLKPGTYAVSFIHDENENGKLDTNFIGIPTEGYGASNDARARFGPPKWADAKFEHTASKQHLVLHPIYF